MPFSLDIDSAAYRLLTGQLIYRYFLVEEFRFFKLLCPNSQRSTTVRSASSRFRTTMYLALSKCPCCDVSCDGSAD